TAAVATPGTGRRPPAPCDPRDGPRPPALARPGRAVCGLHLVRARSARIVRAPGTLTTLHRRSRRSSIVDHEEAAASTAGGRGEVAPMSGVREIDEYVWHLYDEVR